MREQRDLLLEAGAERVFVDEGVPGTALPEKRSGLRELLEYAQPGDQVVAVSLDRFGRSATNLFALVQRLATRDITLRTLRDGIDTAGDDAAGIVTAMRAFAAMEREDMRRRTLVGLEARSARGLPLGRPKVLNPEQRETVAVLRSEGRSASAIAALFGVSKSTIARIPPTQPPDED